MRGTGRHHLDGEVLFGGPRARNHGRNGDPNMILDISPPQYEAITMLKALTATKPQQHQHYIQYAV